MLFAKRQAIPVQVLGAGTNVIFSDLGYEGLVLKVDLTGISIRNNGNTVLITANAGEEWDNFVKFCVDKGFSGLECLSGIPGSVGATPIQNVGAYGYEISDIMLSLKAINRDTLETEQFNNQDCKFGYRTSRFKTQDAEKYIITEITYQLKKDRASQIKYKELKDYLDDAKGSLSPKKIREAVLQIRRSKSMIMDKNDINSRSVGSFYINPILNLREFDAFIEHCNHINIHREEIPFFPTGTAFKVPAAWLIEKAGFAKGYRNNGVGISDKHALALININGTTKELMALSKTIEKAVFNKFGINLIKEATIVD